MLMGILYSFTCRPVNLSTCLAVLTGQDVNIKECRALWIFRTCPPVDLSTCLPGLTGAEVNIGVQGAGHYGYFVLVHLSTCHPYRSSTASGYSVVFHLSTCQPRLTG